jgi:SPP1 family predicted phage head-tail adaptor
MIGKLNKRITIQEQNRTPDGGGGFSVVWQSIAANPSVYASVVPLSGGEVLSMRQLENTVTHRVMIRYRSDITTAMRILNGTEVYDIKSIINIGGRNEYIEILATARG